VSVTKSRLKDKQWEKRYSDINLTAAMGCQGFDDPDSQQEKIDIRDMSGVD
jgi:hypothetical protein